ncbi:MAG: hypothetical protein AABX51_03585 [Nanoarchaeota archaeon]
MEKIKNDLLAFLGSKIKNKKINTDTYLFSSGLLDSMNILDIVGFMEKKLGRKLESEEIVMKNFRSIDAISEAFFNGKPKIRK